MTVREAPPNDSDLWLNLTDELVDLINRQAAALKALEDCTRMSSILLMAGEMTAQERRTAKAVADGIASRVRSALQPQEARDA